MLVLINAFGLLKRYFQAQKIEALTSYAAKQILLRP